MTDDQRTTELKSKQMRRRDKCTDDVIHEAKYISDPWEVGGGGQIT